MEVVGQPVEVVAQTVPGRRQLVAQLGLALAGLGPDAAQLVLHQPLHRRLLARPPGGPGQQATGHRRRHAGQQAQLGRPVADGEQAEAEADRPGHQAAERGAVAHRAASRPGWAAGRVAAQPAKRAFNVDSSHVWRRSAHLGRVPGASSGGRRLTGPIGRKWTD